MPPRAQFERRLPRPPDAPAGRARQPLGIAADDREAPPPGAGRVDAPPQERGNGTKLLQSLSLERSVFCRSAARLVASDGGCLCDSEGGEIEGEAKEPEAKCAEGTNSHKRHRIGYTKLCHDIIRKGKES